MLPLPRASGGSTLPAASLQSAPMTTTLDPPLEPPEPHEPIEPSEPIVSTRTRRPYLDLLLISFLILFLELACLRFFASFVVFLPFFTNIVLIACFLGMSIGCMVASRPRDYVRWVLPLTFVAVGLALAVFHVHQRFGSKIAFDVG